MRIRRYERVRWSPKAGGCLMYQRLTPHVADELAAGVVRAGTRGMKCAFKVED